jgi:hypothetical protein
MSHRPRFPSDVKTNAPLRVPTSTLTPLEFRKNKQLLDSQTFRLNPGKIVALFEDFAKLSFS